MKRILFGSDIHSGHWCGLIHPDHRVTPAACSPKYVRRFYAMQSEVLWPFVKKTLRAIGPVDAACLNGDLIDGRAERNGGKQLWAGKVDDQCANAIAVLKEIQTKKYSMAYGTPYHVGQLEDSEDAIAAALGAEIATEAHYTVNGFNVNMAHTLGNTKSPASRLTALSNEQVRQLLWADTGHQPRADLIVRGHVHRCQDGGSWGDNWRAMTLPALCGLGDDYGSRQYRGLPVHFGFVLLEVEDRDNWQLKPYILKLNLLKATVTKL